MIKFMINGSFWVYFYYHYISNWGRLSVLILVSVGKVMKFIFTPLLVRKFIKDWARSKQFEAPWKIKF
jgi:hypothetical protein